MLVFLKAKQHGFVVEICKFSNKFLVCQTIL